MSRIVTLKKQQDEERIKKEGRKRCVLCLCCFFSLIWCTVIWREDVTEADADWGKLDSIQRDLNGRQPHRTCAAFLLLPCLSASKEQLKGTGGWEEYDVMPLSGYEAMNQC